MIFIQHCYYYKVQNYFRDFDSQLLFTGVMKMDSRRQSETASMLHVIAGRIKTYARSGINRLFLSRDVIGNLNGKTAFAKSATQRRRDAVGS